VSPTRRPKRSAAPRKSEKKRTSGRPSCAELCSPGSGNEIERALNDDLLRRSAGDREDVHRDDQDGDEEHPAERLEEEEKPPRDADDRRDLHEVRCDVEVGQFEQDADADESDRGPAQPLNSRPPQGQGDQGEQECEGDQPEREEGDVAPEPERPHVLREGVVPGEYG
jgi:hypothetical protein